jgi:hypothetical protein
MMMSDHVADHTAEDIRKHILKCQGVDSFRHWPQAKRHQLVEEFLSEQPEGDMYCLESWLRSKSMEPTSYL